MDRFKVFRKFSGGLLNYAADAFFGNTSKEKGGNMIVLITILIVLGLFIILLYAGAEALFLLCRTKFGTKGVKKFRAIIAAAVFLFLAHSCYNYYEEYIGIAINLGSETSFLLASITFLVVGLVVLIKGITAGGPDDYDVIDPIYRGNSWLLGGLIKEGWKQSTVQDIAEPLLFLAIGCYLYTYNIVWGLPFIFCAMSCWLHLGIEAVFGFFDERKELSNEGHIYTENRKIAKVLN